jgi:hypothetical protein
MSGMLAKSKNPLSDALRRIRVQPAASGTETHIAIKRSEDQLMSRRLDGRAICMEGIEDSILSFQAAGSHGPQLPSPAVLTWASHLPVECDVM